MILMMVLPGIVVMLIILMSDKKMKLIKQMVLLLSIVELMLSLCLWVYFDDFMMYNECLISYKWVLYYNINYTIGIDGISLLMLNLTNFLITICILCSWKIKYRLKDFLILLFIIQFCLINVFIVLDLILFYIFFESVLIPMFLIIGVWGSRERKIHAAYQFFVYTLLGSLLMLLSIVLIHFSKGTTDIYLLKDLDLSIYRERIIWLAFFFSFAVKIPMFPFHIWLPEAHVEAPTAGSVLLAGILLKLGGYGFLRFSLPLLGESNFYFGPLIYILSILGVIYCSLTTIRQIDMKKIIAYSSVAHMNYVTVGIFSNTIQGLEGCIYLMISHGLVSSGLFLCVGMLYDRYKTRLISYYGGIVTIMPIFSIFFLFLILSNISFPGTSSFIGEILILLGSIKLNTVVAFFLFLGVILGAVYSMFLYNRILFSCLRDNKNYNDVNYREAAILFYLVYLIILLGFQPNLILERIHFHVFSLLK